MSIKVKTTSHHLPFSNGAGLGREVHADAQDATRVGGIGLGIAFLLNLLQRLVSTTVHLELEDIDVTLQLQRAIHPTVALAVLDADGLTIDAQETKQQVEGVLEMLLRGLDILQRLMTVVGDAGEEGRE